MQKKLIALAVAGLAAAPAFAQTNVTIYGVADATYDSISVDDAKVSGQDIGRYSRISTNSSLIGFRGTEDLGNGLKAQFQFESSVGFDSGAGLNTLRDSFVGLTGNFGTVRLGNLTGPTRALGTALDVNAGATSIGANEALLGKLSNILVGSIDGNSSYATSLGNNLSGQPCGRSSTCASIFDTRWKNSIAYVSPSFYGVTGTFVYVADEGKTRDGQPSATKQDTWGYDSGLTYSNGPILAGVTYNRVSLRNNSNIKVADFRVGGMYDFGMASVRALWERTSLTASGGGIDQQVWGVGGTFNVTKAGKLVAQYYKADDLEGNGTNAQDTGAKHWEVGYEHSLSKRTMLKAYYSEIKNDDNAWYDYGINAAGITAAAHGADVSGFSLGLRHTF